MLKIISSNIRFDNPQDIPHSWDKRKIILAKTNLDFSPDIIGTQEGRRNQLYDLKNLLKNYALADGHRQWIVERMYPCIFFNPKRLQLNHCGDIWLSQTPSHAGSSSFHSAFPRLATWAIFTHIELNFKFICVNLHLDHVKEKTRLEQIRVLIKEVNKINNNFLPMIIMGDFNEGPKKNVYNLIKSEFPFLNDPWVDLNNIEETSHHKFNGKFLNGSRIDWILCDLFFKPQKIYFDKISDDNIFPSDHFPLRCILEI